MGFSKFVIYLAGLYFTILFIFLSVPDIQGHLVVLHWVNYPSSKPSETYKYWIKESIVENFYIEKSGIKLGAWIIGASIKSLKSGSNVFVYVHGNAKDRSDFHRTRMYKILSKTFPVIAFDYSCFGDSRCRHSSWIPPSEDELVDDLDVVIDFLVSKGIKYGDISIVAHSLGTGVASKFLYHNPQAKIAGLCLLAPMASIPMAVIDYPILPVLKPFTFFSSDLKLAIMDLIHIKFNNTLHIPNLDIPILLIHGSLDKIVPLDHSQMIYNAVLDLKDEAADESIFNHLTNIQDVLSFFNSSISHGWNHVPVRQGNSFNFYRSENIRFLQLKFARHNDLESFDLTEEYLNEFIADVFTISFDAPII
eukprot:NODE_370_length_9954_cov_0.501776.p3 type:complete len:364 gc:universal NODE_370_length_9954_cov_0.501776:6327-7418(+)